MDAAIAASADKRLGSYRHTTAEKSSGEEGTLKRKVYVSTLLMDTESEEPYVLHLVENAQGAFVGEVRAAYWAVLDRIGASCGEHGSFHGQYVEDLLHLQGSCP